MLLRSASGKRQRCLIPPREPSPKVTCVPRHASRHSLPGNVSKCSGSTRWTALSFAPVTTAAANGCSLPRSRLATRRSTRSPRSLAPPDRNQLGLPLRYGPGLVNDQRVHLLHRFESLGILDQDPRHGSATGSHHDGHGGGQAQGAGAGDDQHGDSVDDRISQAPAAAPRIPKR